MADLVTDIDLGPYLDDLDGAEPLGWWRLRQAISLMGCGGGTAPDHGARGHRRIAVHGGMAGLRVEAWSTFDRQPPPATVI